MNIIRELLEVEVEVSYLPNISFRIESIRAERYSYEALPQLNIGIRIMFGKPEKMRNDMYKVGFVIKLDCNPPVASIDVKGTALVAPTNPEERRSLEQDLDKGRVPYPLMVATYSYILPIVSLLTRELGLPPPIPPPPPPMKQSESSGKIDYRL